MFFSIVCPVYNSESFLRETINSVIEQSFGDWELILVNDGSTDQSLSICQYFVLIDSRIKVIDKHNNGQMKARVDGIKEAHGEYIVFLDSDDLLDKSTLKTLFNSLRDTKWDGILFNALSFPNNSMKPLPFSSKSFIIQSNYDALCFTFGNQMFGYLWMYCLKKDLLESIVDCDNPFINIRYTEDVAFLYMTIKNIKTLGVIKDTLYYYRNNYESITHNLTSEDRRNRFIVFNYIYNDIFEKYPSFFLSSELATMISWAMFSYVEHSEDRRVTIMAFKEARTSTIFRKITGMAKTKNKLFKIYKILMRNNLPLIFYLLSKKKYGKAK